LAQLEKLRVVKRLLDAGHRPGRIVPLALDQLQALSDEIPDLPGSDAADGMDAQDLESYIALIREHDSARLRGALTRHLSRVGVAHFVTAVLPPLGAAVGDAWLRGQMEIFEEHLYSEVVQVVMRSAIASVPETTNPESLRVLLSTFPGEPHGLGILLAEALLTVEGCRCTSLGPQTPLWDLVLAARAIRADVVALSFTGCMNPNQIVEGLVELRSKLPPGVQVWAGGPAPVLFRRPLEGVQAFADLRSLAQAVSSARLTSGS
jgi:methanogenic corrinoid protein MtbC1